MGIVLKWSSWGSPWLKGRAEARHCASLHFLCKARGPWWSWGSLLCAIAHREWARGPKMFELLSTSKFDITHGKQLWKLCIQSHFEHQTVSSAPDVRRNRNTNTCSSMDPNLGYGCQPQAKANRGQLGSSVFGGVSSHTVFYDWCHVGENIIARCWG